MKKNRLQFAIVYFLLILLLACTKDEPVDYRDKMTGEYSYTIKYSTVPPSILYKDTSLSCNGFINKSNEFDNKIIIDWGPDSISFDGVNLFTEKKFELTVDMEGNLSYPEYHMFHNNTQFSHDAFIRNDSINYWISSGGKSMAFIWNVSGIKTSK